MTPLGKRNQTNTLSSLCFVRHYMPFQFERWSCKQKACNYFKNQIAFEFEIHILCFSSGFCASYSTILFVNKFKPLLLTLKHNRLFILFNIINCLILQLTYTFYNPIILHLQNTPYFKLVEYQRLLIKNNSTQRDELIIIYPFSLFKAKF